MNEFLKEENIIETNDKEKNTQLINSILETRDKLKRAHTNFEIAEDELIDFYAYEIKANQAKLNYLTKLAKSKNLIITFEMYRDNTKVV